MIDSVEKAQAIQKKLIVLYLVASASLFFTQHLVLHVVGFLFSAISFPLIFHMSGEAGDMLLEEKRIVWRRLSKMRVKRLFPQARIKPRPSETETLEWLDARHGL